MSQKRDESPCQIICWSLSVLAGVLMTVAVSAAWPVLLALVVGLAVMAGMGVLMQRHICGLAVDNWGPFEGLKGVPGWDADGPHDEADDRPAARGEKAMAPDATGDAPAAGARHQAQTETAAS